MSESESKENILISATLLFAENGYKETSVREIAKNANANVSMISYYFGGKEGILQFIMANMTKQLSFYLDQLDLESVENFQSFLRTIMDFLDSNRNEFKILFSEIGKGNDLLIPLKEKISDMQNKFSLIVIDNKNRPDNSLISRKMKIITDIVIGMIFSNYIFDFSNFQKDFNKEDQEKWREERTEMVLKIIENLSGIDAGKLSMEYLF